MSEKEVYQEKLDAQFQQWSAKVDELKAKADQANTETQLEYYEQIEELRFKQAAAYAKLQELRNAGERAWGELKPGLEHALDNFKNAVEKAVAKLT
jgi:uncharacterized coiled-coil DUF342 family protein